MISEILQILQESTQFMLGILGYSPHQEIVGNLMCVSEPFPDVPVQEAWIGAAIAAATSIAGAIMNSRKAHDIEEKNQSDLNKQRAEANALYNRRYYEDGTQRADVSRALTEANNRLKRQNQSVAGANAVMGATNATSAAQKEANNEAYANMVSQAASAAESRKDAVEDRYVNSMNNIHQQQRDMTQKRGEAQIASVREANNGVVSLANAYEAGNYQNEFKKDK